MHNIKEWLKNVNIRITALLTPVSYAEYAIKMLFILTPKNLLKFLRVDIIMHLVLLLISIVIEPVLVSASAILFSAILSLIVLGGFIFYRISLKRSSTKLDGAEIKFNPIDIEKVNIPSKLQAVLDEYNTQREENQNEG